jgi:hypothetical protein
MSNGAIYLILIAGVVLPIYFAPFAIANGRHHNNQAAIFMLNLLLGWTLLGWIIAMIWACTNNRQQA